MLVFAKKEIVLDLPAGGSELKVIDGWKILPLTYPQVKIILQCIIHTRYYTCLLYRLTKLILSNISVEKMSLDAPLGWSG